MDNDEQQQEDRHISHAHLHWAYPSTFNITQTKLKELKSMFIIKRGRWSKKEDKRLMKNWRRFVRRFPDYSDPMFAFGISHGLHEQMSERRIRKIKHRYKKLKVMFRVAYKLDNRLICDIYHRCRLLFYREEFYYNSRKNLPKEIEEKVIQDIINGESDRTICLNYSVSPRLIETIKRRPKKSRYYKWNNESDMFLEQVIEQVTGIEDVRTIPTHEIDWNMISKEMNTLNYKVTKEQCYRRWSRLVPDMVGVR